MPILAAILFYAAAMDAPADSRISDTREVISAGETSFVWLNGWEGDLGRPRSPKSPQWISVSSDSYGFVLDAQRMTIPHFGPFGTRPADVRTALDGLPPAVLTLTITVDGRTYHCVQGAEKQEDTMNFPVRLIEGGRFVQRLDILNLVFEDAEKHRAPVAARLEIIAWPDRLSLLIEVLPARELPGAELHLAFAQQEDRSKTDGDWKMGVPLLASVSWTSRPISEGTIENVAAANLRDDCGPLEVVWDAMKHWFRIALPKESWSIAADPDHVDRVRVELENPAGTECVFPLMFTRDEPFEGVTGMCPMIRDASGQPTGIPVQISKNWHRQKDRRMLYEGPWFHGFTMLRLPPKSRYVCEFTVAYARWGGVPAASHAQLCLIGWGHNQVWDQAAIGSWGESICYEPDAIQKRCRITDVRPLMVRSMSGNQPKWTWTNNVGGGDFLVYYDESGTYQFVKNVRTQYLSQGPCLTRVAYSGITADETLSTRMEVSLPRCDDITRVFHKVRYEVLKATRFKRLAFYQLGADDYNWNTNGQIARGNENGVVEEWKPNYGGRVYDRTGIPCEGAVPWFAMLDTAGHDKNPGVWANRGLVIRAWKARIGGREAPPFASVYRSTSGNFDSALIELSPPPGVSELHTGDFVEADIEMVIMPQAADDYYGPNEPLREALEADASTWKMFHREAVGNRLDVQVRNGILHRAYPVEIACSGDDPPAFEIRGGVGYVPITISRIGRHNDFELLTGAGNELKPLDQSVHGNDFWQTDHDPETRTWSRTYNVNLDGSRTRRFLFRPR